MSVEEYKRIFKAPVVDPAVNEKRRETSMRLYGNPNYKNEEAKKLSNEIFEGGHSLRDPKVREKAKQTKLRLYGDANFTNRDKTRETCLERYGVTNVGKVKAVVDKRVRTCIERYGKVFNYTPPPVIEKAVLEDMHLNRRMSLVEIADELNLTQSVVSYWVHKYGIQVTKRVVVPKHKEFFRPDVIVRAYFEKCQEHGKVLSFYEYGSVFSGKEMLRIKRLFNRGGRFSSLKEELFQMALLPGEWNSFLSKLNSQPS